MSYRYAGLRGCLPVADSFLLAVGSDSEIAPKPSPRRRRPLAADARAAMEALKGVPEAQVQEIEALLAIYMVRLTRSERVHRAATQWPRARHYTLLMYGLPQESLTVLPLADGRAVIRIALAPNLVGTGEENFVAAALIVRLPPAYPQDLPELVVEKIKGLSMSQIAALQKRLELKVCHHAL